MVSVLGWGQAAWCERLTCHFGILRLMTRGAERGRRAGVSRLSNRRRNDNQPGVSRPCWSGGKIARVGEGLPGDPERGDEADPVRVASGVGSGLGHQGADGVVTAQVSPDLLEDQVW